jgi:hypothetical protein
MLPPLAFACLDFTMIVPKGGKGQHWLGHSAILGIGNVVPGADRDAR